jgi:hypothetical protein
MGQVYLCWWRICREIIAFSSFEYHVFYVLYPFVIYVLTLPRTCQNCGEYESSFNSYATSIVVELPVPVRSSNLNLPHLGDCECSFRVRDSSNQLEVLGADFIPPDTITVYSCSTGTERQNKS